MAESSSFTSLLALIDNHLSKTNIQTSQSDDTGQKIQENPGSIPTSSLSDTSLAFPTMNRLPIPKFKLSDNTNPIQNILAEQVANMLKAKDKKKKEEEDRERLNEEMRRLKVEEVNNDRTDGDCIIDLMAALRTPGTPFIPIKETLSISSSQESLFELKYNNYGDSNPPSLSTSPEPLLPCKTDMSYILKAKIKGAKCSSFGKVLMSRLRPVAAPYLREKYVCNIVPFDFNTKSPSDLIKDKLRKPTSYNSYY